MTKSLVRAACAIALCAGCSQPVGTSLGDKNTDSSRVGVDLDAFNLAYPGDNPVTQIEQAYRVTVEVGDLAIPADTHLFGDVTLIPFDNGDDASDAAGKPLGRGDRFVAEHFSPGEIGIGIMHHRPEFRTLSLEGQGPEMKEHFKLQDTHIEIVVGVENRDGSPGVVTLNNPQNYEGGRFGSQTYVPMFFRPRWPEYLDGLRQELFEDNVRTMSLGFNAVSKFPGSYNGGDPLAAHSVEKVRNHTRQMVRAIAGDEDARDWFEEPANKIYCAELAHVAFSAGLIVPLNEATMVPLLNENNPSQDGEAIWDTFVGEMARHNAGEPTAFTTLNANSYAAAVQVTTAPEDLHTVSHYSPDPADAERLAFLPMTMADIVEHFLRTHLPRETLGEQLAPVQGQILALMKPALFETMGLDRVPETHPSRITADQLFEQVVQVVSTPFASYYDFRQNIEPLLAAARMATGPRDESGTGFFAPPSLMHIVAQGKHDEGLIGLTYVGHAIHVSLVNLGNVPATDLHAP